MRREAEKYSAYHYNKDGTIVVTDDWKDSTAHTSIPKTYKPFAVIETRRVFRGGETQIDRTYYGQDKIMVRQVHSGNHKNAKTHHYGTHGEHAHDYYDDPTGTTVRITRELNEDERKENQDIL